jgi:hypothetical protein
MTHPDHRHIPIPLDAITGITAEMGGRQHPCGRTDRMHRSSALKPAFGDIERQGSRRGLWGACSVDGAPGGGTGRSWMRRTFSRTATHLRNPAEPTWISLRKIHHAAYDATTSASGPTS